MPEPLLLRDALPAAIRSTIWNLLAEVAQHRPLTRLEIRLRCMTAPRPWRDLGIDRSTFYRRRKRERLAAEMAQAA